MSHLPSTFIHSSKPTQLVYPFDAKSAFNNVVKEAKAADPSLSVFPPNCALPFVVSVQHPRLQVRTHVVRGCGGCHVALEILMPCGDSSLMWMPWAAYQGQPQRQPGEYQHVNFGRLLLMPRRTKCYGHAYTFSGQTHPLEPSTPEAISALYAETSMLFDLGDRGPNMCLENDYDNGREYISEHSDDERQFGELHDVFCWITGNACRTGIFRVRSIKSKVPSTLSRLCCDPADPHATRELFSIKLPAGLYVMHGREFQKNYSHEFPQCQEGMYKRLLLKAPKLWEDFPAVVSNDDKGASRVGVVQAAWLKENRTRVLAAARQGKLAKKRGAIGNDDAAFEEWCLERTSYTLRQFSMSRKKRPWVEEQKEAGGITLPAKVAPTDSTFTTGEK